MRSAPFGRRVGAMLYDGLLVIALWMITTLIYVMLRGGAAASGDPGLQVLLVVVAWLFFAGFWTRHGGTLGMTAWRLKVRDGDDRRPSFARSTLRFAASVLSWIPLGLGFAWQLWDPDDMAWHDRLSGTRLVYLPKNA